jgi:3-oxoadipate enol-lactonase
MRFLRVNGIVVHWRETGPAGAPAVIFANSLGTDFRIWDEVANALAGRYRIVTYDKRGHGLSDEPAGPYSIDNFASDTLALIDHLGIETFAFVGLSVGGMIAQKVAVRAANRLKALVLCDTAVKIGDAAVWNARIEAVETQGLSAIADAVLERWFSSAFRRNRTDELAGWRNMLIRSPQAGYAATCAALRDANLTDDAPKITAPTLFAVGSEDGSTPPDLVRESARLVPQARFEVIEDSGHLPCIDQPVKLANLITGHFGEAGYV